jgi:hypothetical protein
LYFLTFTIRQLGIMAQRSRECQTAMNVCDWKCLSCLWSTQACCEKNSANDPRRTGSPLAWACGLAISRAPLECGSLLSLLPPWFDEACFAIPGREAGTTTNANPERHLRGRLRACVRLVVRQLAVPGREMAELQSLLLTGVLFTSAPSAPLTAC